MIYKIFVGYAHFMLKTYVVKSIKNITYNALKNNNNNYGIHRYFKIFNQVTVSDCLLPVLSDTRNLYLYNNNVIEYSAQKNDTYVQKYYGNNIKNIIDYLKWKTGSLEFRPKMYTYHTNVIYNELLDELVDRIINITEINNQIDNDYYNEIRLIITNISKKYTAINILANADIANLDLLANKSFNTLKKIINYAYLNENIMYLHNMLCIDDDVVHPKISDIVDNISVNILQNRSIVHCAVMDIETRKIVEFSDILFNLSGHFDAIKTVIGDINYFYGNNFDYYIPQISLPVMIYYIVRCIDYLLDLGNYNINIEPKLKSVLVNFVDDDVLDLSCKYFDQVQQILMNNVKSLYKNFSKNSIEYHNNVIDLLNTKSMYNVIMNNKRGIFSKPLSTIESFPDLQSIGVKYPF